MSLAVITRLDAGQDLWRLAFYERDGERLNFRSSVNCCWDSVRIILKLRRQNEGARIGNCKEHLTVL